MTRFVALPSLLIVVLLFALGCDSDTAPPATPQSTVTPTPEAPATPHKTPTATPVSAAQGRIAFVSERDGNREIYVVGADGSGLTNVTNHPALDLSPTWSPDGTQLAFTSDRDGNTEIYVVDSNGSGLTKLTNTPSDERTVAWSPDGSLIAFASASPEAAGDLYVMGRDGSSPTKLTDNLFVDFFSPPSWSPNGSRLAFAAGHHEWDIFVVNVDGSGLTDLTSGASELSDPSRANGQPKWSPDGMSIAFVSKISGQLEIFLMNADGSDITRLTDTREYKGQQSWSPDSSQIAFLADQEALWVVGRDGSSPLRLHAGFTTTPPAWSPDGEYLAVAALPLDQPESHVEVYSLEIFTVSADGSALTRLTQSPGIDDSPVWSPVP